MALWANCVPHLCQAKQAGNRREAGGDPLRLPPNLSRASGVGLSPNQCRPSGKPESAKKLFFLPPFPASAGTWHSFLPPSSESIALRNANKKDQISKSRVSAPPPGGWCGLLCFTAPTFHHGLQSPHPIGPFFTSFLANLRFPLFLHALFIPSLAFGALLLLFLRPRGPVPPLLAWRTAALWRGPSGQPRGDVPAHQLGHLG